MYMFNKFGNFLTKCSQKCSPNHCYLTCLLFELFKLSDLFAYKLTDLHDMFYVLKN